MIGIGPAFVGNRRGSIDVFANGLRHCAGKFLQGGHNVRIVFVAVRGEQACGQIQCQGLVQIHPDGGQITVFQHTEPAVILPDGRPRLLQRPKIPIHRTPMHAESGGDIRRFPPTRGSIQKRLDRLEAFGAGHRSFHLESSTCDKINISCRNYCDSPQKKIADSNQFTAVSQKKTAKSR